MCVACKIVNSESVHRVWVHKKHVCQGLSCSLSNGVDASVAWSELDACAVHSLVEPSCLQDSNKSWFSYKNMIR